MFVATHMIYIAILITLLFPPKIYLPLLGLMSLIPIYQKIGKVI